MLTVESDEPARHRAKVLGGDGAALKVRARSALGGDATRKDQLVGVELDTLAQLGEVGVACKRVIRGEHALDVGLARAGPQDAAPALAAEQQVERMGEKRLAGAGLARDDVEAGIEPQLGALDQEEVFDAELEEHPLILQRPPVKSRSFSLKRE